MANTGLGRGLGSLIPNKTNQPNTTSLDSNTDNAEIDVSDKVLKIDVNSIKVNPMQPRQRFADRELDELVESIKEYGVIQPLIVSQQEDGFELIAGERRLRASKQAGLEKVPVIVRSADAQEKLEVALIENIQRENLNPIDLAEAYKKLIEDFSLTQEQVAKKVSKARPSVANTMRLLNLPEEVKLAIIEGKLTEGHAKFIVGLESEEKQMSLFRKILRNNMSVVDTNKAVRIMGGTKKAKIKINYEDKDKEFRLREFFGSKAEIKRTQKGGQIIIDFYSDEELSEMINKIK